MAYLSAVDAFHEALTTVYPGGGMTLSEIAADTGFTRGQMERASAMHRVSSASKRITNVCNPPDPERIARTGSYEHVYRLVNTRVEAMNWLTTQYKYLRTRTTTALCVLSAVGNAITGRSRKAMAAKAEIDAEVDTLKGIVSVLTLGV